MSIPRTVAEVIREHVCLEVEGIDRMYLNVYVPTLQREGGVASFFRFHRGYQFASSALMDPISKAFVAEMEQFAKQGNIPVVRFGKGQRKDDVAAEYRKKFQGQEGVLFIGKAQEKTPVFRTERRRNEKTGATYPWLVRSTAMVNHFYVYCMDRDFGSFFLKFCTYFPYTTKLCLNGHEYAKQQLNNRGIGYEALDNGILSCEDPRRVQTICDGLSAEKIDGLLRKWFRKLPHRAQSGGGVERILLARGSVARYVTDAAEISGQKARDCAASYHDAGLTIMHGRTGLEALHRSFRRVRANHAQMFFHDAVAALKAQPPQFFVQADSGQIRIAFQQLRDLIHIRVQQTRPAETLAFLFPGPGALAPLQHAVHALAADSQLQRNGSLRSAGIVQADNLVARGFPH